MHTIAKWPLTLVAVWTLASGQATAVTGRVVRAADGAPLRFASVAAVSADGTINRTSSSDRDGNFAIGELVPGRYTIRASAPGYASAASPLVVGQGETREPLILRMARAGVLTGRVVDARGRPVSGVPVHALMSEFRGGREILRQLTRRPRISDDRGLFRLFGLEPATYYVATLPGAFGDDPGGRRPSHAVSYYPGGASLVDAQPVIVAADREHEIGDLVVRQAALSSIDGIAVDARGMPVRGAEIVLVPADGPLPTMLPMTSTRDDGRFSFSNVAPGVYAIQNLPTPASSPEFGSVTITAAGGPLSVTLPLQPARPMRGTVVFEEGAPDFRPEQLSVLLRSALLHKSPIARGARARVLADWTFEITNLWGPHFVNLADPVNGWMLKQVLVGAEDFIGRAIDFSDLDASRVTIVLTRRAASVAGRVVDRDRRPLPNAGLLLYSTDSRRWFEDLRAIRRARTDGDGGFRVDGIPPGMYLLAMHDLLEDGDWPPRPIVLDALRASAVTVSITEPREYKVTMEGAK